MQTLLISSHHKLASDREFKSLPYATQRKTRRSAALSASFSRDLIGKERWKGTLLFLVFLFSFQAEQVKTSPIKSPLARKDDGLALFFYTW